ncbi:hypothetical protein MB02_01565 [Croceicoccus estronivorus]|uniref:hypothetical protein n=1 Tax=Croceicoccus estronivorus TaxID=1172626 RepID=UPI00082C770E|nr:hypothetical protein [Croceicoccus estronivorus]OCC25377.1 hypothetical protein MB02_01565 [Croceicoccus estronivorus]
MRKTIVPATLALLALSACGEDKSNEPEPTGSTTTQQSTETERNSGIADASNPPPLSDSDSKSIPLAAQGRWGLVPADCTSTRGDAKGLLKIDGTTLQFYESVGTLDEIQEISGTRLRASFDFTGEGMSWSREEVLDVQDGGKTLIRREYGKDALPGPFEYSKCT